MLAFAVAAGCWALGALALPFAKGRSFPTLLWIATAGAGGIAAVAAAAVTLLHGETHIWVAPWSVPGGALAFRLDPLAAFFLLPVAAIGALGAVYGASYRRHHASAGGRGAALAVYNLLLLSMAVVVTANNLVLLIVAWELMTLASWALVVHDHEQELVRSAGIRYLVAGHLATAALLLVALILSASNGTFGIAALSRGGAGTAGVVFVLVLVGFGTKAGVVPMHVWLPDAHAAAPSHVSALMSGVMVTMGFYGMSRFIPLLGAPPVWWAYVLLVLGAAGATGGMLFSLAQRDVKRALAYSTVEHAGLITLALGVWLLGTALHDPLLVALGWMAAALHMWNHALAKSLLFLGFGAVAQRAESRDLDALGGFAGRWAIVGGALVLGAGAIASLPGLNVFTSEWLLARALLTGILNLTGLARIAVIGALTAMAFTGGLAVAGLSRVVGVGLLGAARTPRAAEAREPGWGMRAPMVILAAGCVAVAAAPTRVATLLASTAVGNATPAIVALGPLIGLVPLLLALVLAVVAFRFAWTRGMGRRAAPTWGCGFAPVTPSMQYSSTSFGGAVTDVMQPVLRTERHATSGADGSARPPLWPVARDWESFTPDRVLVALYEPVLAWAARSAARVRTLHRARVTTSLLYVVSATALLLALLFIPGFGT